MIELSGVKDKTEKQELAAGRFSSWLRRTRRALVKEDSVEVPCGECNACCRSSYFIHIRAEETQTLARIPEKLLFPAPGLPKGNVLLGFDENGHCPMLIDDKCSIYEDRPQTCRNYDCRIFPATGISVGEENKTLITQQIQRWKFSFPTKRDSHQYSALQAAAKFLQEHADCFPAGVVPSNSTQLAILAIKVYDVFLEYNSKSGRTECIPQDGEVAQSVMEAIKKFETRGE